MSCKKSEEIEFPLTLIVPIEDSAAAGAASNAEFVDDGDSRQAFWRVEKSEKGMLIATRIKCDTEVTEEFLQENVFTDTMTDDRRFMSRKSVPPSRLTLGWDGDPYAGTLHARPTGNLTLGPMVEMVNAVTRDFEDLQGACDNTFTVKNVTYEAKGDIVEFSAHDIVDTEFAKWLKLLEEAKTKQGGLKTITEFIGGSKKKKASKEDTRDAQDDGDDSGGEDDYKRLEKGTQRKKQTWDTFTIFSGKKEIGEVKYQKKDGWTNINAVLEIRNTYVKTVTEDEVLFFHFEDIGDSASESSASEEADGGKSGSSGSSSDGSSDNSDQSYIEVAGSASGSESGSDTE